MASPVTSAYSQLDRQRTPYLNQMVPNLTLPGFSIPPHPDFVNYYPIWRTLRDCYAGEPAIKGQGQVYLRKLTAHKDAEYEGFLSRAYFYNAVRRTHDGLMASLFRKPPEITLPGPAQAMRLDDATLDGQPLTDFIKQCASEVTLMGRYGILVDMPVPDPENPNFDHERPYLSGYAAECVYAWREVMHRGRRVLDRVILRENETHLSEYGIVNKLIIRVLRLDPDPEDLSRMIYSQEVIRPHDDAEQPPSVEQIPVTIRGRQLGYIPFVFVNAKNLTPACVPPPLADIASINVSHYQSTALLEHGRFYAGMPTYVIAAGSETGEVSDGTPLAVGPSSVWELEKDAKAWILEFNGHGLSFLENAVDSKQLQMQSLGGKLISSQRKAAALSSEAYALMEAGDEATLMDVAEQLERGIAKALTFMADFYGIEFPSAGTVDAEGRTVDTTIQVEMNKEFVRSDLTARELRAIQSLYTSGLIPLDVLYYALRSVNVIPIEYTLEDFRRMMDDKSQLYSDTAGEQARKDALKNKIEAARIAAHVDEPAYQPIPAPGHEPAAPIIVQPGQPPSGAPVVPGGGKPPAGGPPAGGGNNPKAGSFP